MGAIFKIAPDMAGSTFGQNAISFIPQTSPRFKKKLWGKIEWGDHVYKDDGCSLELEFVKEANQKVRLIPLFRKLHAMDFAANTSL